MQDYFNDFNNNSDRELSLIDRFTSISDGNVNPNGIDNLISLVLFFFFVIYLYLSFPSFDLTFSGSFMPGLIISLLIPHIYLGLSIFFWQNDTPRAGSLLSPAFS